MDTARWVEEKPEREKAALERHERLSKLFRENRFLFEMEVRKMRDAVIDNAPDESLRQKLRAIQNDWDRKLNGAGTRDNRFVLARTFFWEHFNDVWLPGIQQVNIRLNNRPQNPPEK